MSFHKKVVYAFNNFYLNFLTDLKKYNDEFRKTVKRNFKVFDKSANAYFDTMRTSFSEHNDDDAMVELLPSVTYGYISEQLSADASAKRIVTSYFIIFKVLYMIYDDEDETILEKVLELIRDAQDTSISRSVLEEKLREVLDDELSEQLTNLMDTLKSADGGGSTPDGIPAMFENSKIGGLAKEISEEINLADLNISNPAELLDLRNLTSSNNVLGNIVSKVSEKIQTKISNGSLSQTELVNEAMSFIGMLNSGDGAGGGSGSGSGGSKNNIMDLLNNPMMSELISSMSKDKNVKATVDQSKLRSLSTKQRLQAKLEKRRQEKTDTEKK